MTVTFTTTPSVPGGVVAVMMFGLSTVKLIASVSPKRTVSTPVKPCR